MMTRRYRWMVVILVVVPDWNEAWLSSSRNVRPRNTSQKAKKRPQAVDPKEDPKDEGKGWSVPVPDFFASQPEKNPVKEDDNKGQDDRGFLGNIFRRKKKDEKEPLSKDSKTKESIRKEKQSKKLDSKPETDEEKRNFFNPLPFFQGVLSNAFKGNDRVPEEWVPVIPKTRLSPGEIVPATIGGIDLLVIASRDGRKLYCIANSCPHLGTPLETGKLVRLPIEGDVESKTASQTEGTVSFTETEISQILQQDGCEDCIVCPLHRTAFALESGEVRGTWCPYPPVVGALVGTIKKPTSVAVFDVRTKGKLIEVRINTPLESETKPTKKKP